jgi:opacity protein-like surface antigen
MNSRSILQSNTLLFAWVIISFFSSLTGQSQTGRSTPSYAVEKPVVSYYEDLDDKTFYHQRRIHGMKGELNNYSEKLHKLQARFDQIFYGLTAENSFTTPFDVSNQPARPSRPRRSAFESNATNAATSNAYAGPGVQASNTFSSPQTVITSNTLAFNVDSPGQSSSNDRPTSVFSKGSSNGGSIGTYLIVTPGVSFPHKIHKTAQSYRKYDPGFAVSLAGGFKKEGFRFGLGTSYGRNSFHETSYNTDTVSGLKVSLSQESETFTVYLDLGYEFALVGSLEGYLGTGLGYYLSHIEDPLSRDDRGFYATGSIGLAYNFSEAFALRLGYRYHHEEEVPAHLTELGLDLEF